MAFEDFRTLVENSPDVIVRYDRECRRLYANPAHERVNGIPIAELIGKKPSELASRDTIAGAQALAVEELLLKVVNTGVPCTTDLTWKGRAKEPICFELRATPEFEDGAVVSVLTVARDMSAQRESARWASMLGSALDHAPEAVYLTQPGGDILYVNGAGCREIGVSRAALVGSALAALIPEFSVQNSYRDLRGRDGAGTLIKRGTCRRRDGSGFPVEIKVSRLEFDDQDFMLVIARNLSDERATPNDAPELSHEFKDLVDHFPHAVGRYDRECRCTYANAVFARAFGLTASDLLGQKPGCLDSIAPAQRFEETLLAVFSDGETRELENTRLSADAHLQTTQMRFVPEYGDRDEIISVLVIGQDVTELKETRRRLQEAETLAGIGHWCWDFKRQTTLVSEAFCRIFDRPAAWRPSLDEMLSLVVEEDREGVRNLLRDAIDRRQSRMAFSYRVRNGNTLQYLHTIGRMEYGPDGSPSRMIATTQDISDLKNTQLRLQNMSQHDLLTGLPNRNLLMDRLADEMLKAERRGSVLGLLTINLDRFKDVNDTHGHYIGDRLISSFAERLRKQVRDHDIVAHLGSDRFAVALTKVRDSADLGTVARKIIDEFATPFRVDSIDIFSSASIGIAAFPSDGTTTIELLQHADAALNEAKSLGNGRVHYYSEQLSLRSRERILLETALRHAEQDRQFELHFQPQVNLVTGELMGAEALIRLWHPELGLVTPNRFIGIAEDTGLVVGMGAWVLTKACLAAQKWNARATNTLRVAVNLSAKQFQGADLLATVRSALSATGCKPAWLELEITESLLLDNDENVRNILAEFRDMGITIAIDDFGTGYSALGYLKRFPIDVLKIDRSFVSDIATDAFNRELVKAIISMGQCLGMETVAEGVETSAQEELLKTYGCNIGQGFRYSKPVPMDEFEALPQMKKIRAQAANTTRTPGRMTMVQGWSELSDPA